MFNQHKTELSQQLSSTQPMMSEEESLTTKFNKYNDLIFSSKLPIPRLKWSRGKTRLGQMAYKRKRSWGRTTFYDYTISVSRYYNLTEEQIDDVLIHEMIHYFIAYTGQRDSSAHGTLFRSMMNDINQRISLSLHALGVLNHVWQKHQRPISYWHLRCGTANITSLLSTLMQSERSLLYYPVCLKLTLIDGIRHRTSSSETCHVYVLYGVDQ